MVSLVTGTPWIREVGQQVCLNPCRFSSQEGPVSTRQRGACPGFGGSDLEKEYESGWGGVPASSAQAVGAGCQAAAAAAGMRNSVSVVLQPEAGGRVCAYSAQNGTFTSSYHLTWGRQG